MNSRITSLLHDESKNYILPFFWQHGENETTLREYMGVIQNCGIGAVCVESRPHPDFCGTKWWIDMDIIMDEARTRNMKVWVLDDSHFPTGYANGLVTKSPDTLCKQYLYYKEVDVCGPQPSTQVDVAAMAKYVKSPFNSAPSFMRGNLPSREFDDDNLLSVCAMQVNVARLNPETCVDLTPNISNGQLVWDVPEGMWKIFVLYTTRNAGNGNPHYINVIDRRSCRLQIDAVYEPHFAHYHADFGKTFAGFFSDEPLFGNSRGFGFDHRIGTKMELPWSVEVPEPLSAKLGDDWLIQLPYLWYEATEPDVTAKVRYAYMDTVTRLVEEDFSNQLGKWCEEHQVEYIGHIIEDNNQHARLGQSFGHFFRGLGGQHMAGIDDIGGQVLVGGEDLDRNSPASFFGGQRDGEFYHFALGKLGSSHAHIDPRKEGRAMCEIYGAYGWGTGVRTMKYLTDHFLVRGINVYVPHAFSPKEYPDQDCPPHFFAQGHNPQYRHFRRLMMYMNRVCNLISDGVHVAPVALLYHGEGEWTGRYMLLQKPARELTEHQIDFDIIPADVFAEAERYQTSIGKTLKVNKEEYQTLVIPYTQYITPAFAEFCVAAQQSQFKVVFVDALPDGVCDGSQTPLPDLSGCAVIPLSELARYLVKNQVNEVEVNHPFRRLRYYHYRGESDVYLFTNEDPGKTFTGEVTVPQKGSLYAYDAWENVLRPQKSEACDQGTKLFLTISPYQSVIVVFDDPADARLLPLPVAAGIKQALNGEWKLSLAKSIEYPAFHDERIITSLQNVALTEPTFSGFMRYETTFSLQPCDSAVLEISEAYEGVEVWVNGDYAGMCICPPFLFDLTALVGPGENSLLIEVANTPEREVASMPKDPNNFFSRIFHPSLLAPSGIVGEVNLYLM